MHTQSHLLLTDFVTIIISGLLEDNKIVKIQSSQSIIMIICQIAYEEKI
jgi:hypothetical protein